jgi:putative transposase
MTPPANTVRYKNHRLAGEIIRPGVWLYYRFTRCENSHRPPRQREWRMQGFKSAGHDQRFLSAYSPIAQHFRPRRHLLSAAVYRDEMRHRCASWAETAGTERAA